MLVEHLAAVEQHLLTTSRIPANAGHSLHKGTPREAFIKEFLEGHLSERIAVGTGEIIDANSKAGEKRNQLDIVLHKRDYPRLDFGGGVKGFLVESVIATISVKSILTKEDLSTDFATSKELKKLKPNIFHCATSGYNAPSILSFVVAYDGPQSLRTVAGWFPDIYKEHALPIPQLPPDHQRRMRMPGPGIDGIYLLGRGFIQNDNCPHTFFTDDERKKFKGLRWQGADVETGALLMFFMWLTSTACNSSEMWLNPGPYLAPLRLHPWPICIDITAPSSSPPGKTD